LHEWSYENATDIGTTITMPDTGSIGGLPMANVDAASKPNLTDDYLETDGVSQYLINSVSNFRFGDNDGVIHVIIKAENGVANFPFNTADNSVNNYYIAFYLGGTRQSTVNLIKGGGTLTLKTTDKPTDGNDVVVSLVNSGANNIILFDGVQVAGYDTDTIGSQWMNNVAGRDNITFGSVQRATPTYGATKMKYAAYCPYVNLATAQNEALLLKANI